VVGLPSHEVDSRNVAAEVAHGTLLGRDAQRKCVAPGRMRTSRRPWSLPEQVLPLRPIDGVRAGGQYWLIRSEPRMSPRFHQDRPVIESSRPLGRPQDGDVVVTREARSRVHYTVRQLPGMVQFSAAVRDEAVRLGLGFGQRHAVDVWYSEGGTYRLLEGYRPPTSARAAPRRTNDAASPDRSDVEDM
jgi:hypothetical protein